MIKSQYISSKEFLIKLLFVSFFVGIIALFNGAVAQPVLSTPTVTAITNNSATLGGTVVSGNTISERGTVWKAGSAPAIGDNKLAEGGTSIAAFTHARSSLTPKSQIFYAPYAIDADGTTVGSGASFYTLADEPGATGSFTSTGQAANTIDLDWASASSGAFGYLVYTATGNTAPTPGLSDGAVFSGTPLNITTPASTSTTISSLTRNSEYSFTIIAYDWDGTNAATYNYRAPLTLTSVFTLEEVPTLTTPTVTSINNDGATLGGTITDNGGGTLTERGIYWSTSSGVTTGDNKEVGTGTATGAFDDPVTGLGPKDEIFYKAYATNGSLTGLSTESSFYTLADEPGATGSFTSTGQAANTIDLDWASASSGAFGYLVYTATGNTAPTPGLSDGAVFSGTPLNITTPASTSTTISSLIRNSEYSFTIIAYDWDGTNAATYNYRAPLTLTSIFTLEEAPTLTTPTVTSINNDGATLGGTVTNNGGGTLTERGIYWSTSSGVTTGDNKEVGAGTANGAFSDAITGLGPKDEIFFKAFATNGSITGLSSESSFFTLANEPGPATTFLASNETSSQIELNWTASTGAPAGYLIYTYQSGTASDPGAVDATSFPTSPTPINITSGTTTTVTSLSPNTEYSFTIIPYDWDLSNDETYNYANITTIDGAFTLCNYPSTQPTSLNVSAINGSQFKLKWTGAPSSDRTLVVVKQGSPVDANPLDGAFYSGSYTFGNGSQIGTGNFVISTNKSNTGGTFITNLQASTAYHVAMFSYNNSTKCYNIVSAATTTGTTTGPLSTSTISSGTGAASLSSMVNSAGSEVAVFSFTMIDLGDDGLDTEFSELIFTPATGNDIADWTTVIAGARLYHNERTGAEHGTAVITATSIKIPSINSNDNRLGELDENETKTYQLKIYLESNLGSLKSSIDGQNLAFELLEGGFTYVSGKTKFNPATSTNSNADTGDNNPIAVVATEINYTTEPSTIATATVVLSSQPILEATDANGNRDLDFGESIAVTTSPDLGPASALSAFSAGIADFTASGFNFQNVGTSDITITASPSSYSATSFADITVSASTTVAEITGGIATSPLSSNSTNKALIGFSLVTTGSTLGFTGGDITTSSDPDGKIKNLKLYSSTDNDYSTAGDNTLIGTAVFTTPDATTIHMVITGINVSGTISNFFIVADVETNVFSSTPTLQLSVASTGDLTVSTGAVIGTPFTGDVYSFVDVTPPTILSTTALVDPIYDGVLVQSIRIIYSEPMQTGVDPTIAFANSGDFTTSAGAWSTTTYTNDTWTQPFTHGSVSEEFTESVTVSAGRLDVAGNAEASGSTSNTFVLDTKNPTATVTRSINSITQGVTTQTVTVTYSEAMDPAGVKEPTINFGTSIDFTSNSDGVWSVGNTVWTESFTHGSVQEEIATETAVVPTTSGATDIAGNTDIGASSPSFILDTKQPRIASITSTTATGIYTAPTVVTIEVNMDEPVTITGTPQLTLNTVPSAAVVNYNPTGSTTTKLIFTYSITANQNADPLDVASISLNGGTITDGVSNSIDLTLPLTPNRLQDNKSIEVDTKQPSITSVTSATASGYYNDFNVISIQITFDEIVSFTGTPQLSLNSGGTASYVAGAPGLIHNFTYTVGTTDNANPLDYAATNSLTLIGGTIKDAVNLDAILTLPAIGGGSSIQDDKTIIIDTDEPIANTLTPTDDGFNYPIDGDFIIQFAEDIQVINNGVITIFKSDSNVVVGSYDMTLAPAEVTFNGTDQITINPVADLDKTTGFYISIDGTIVLDLAGNQFAGYAADTDWNFVSFGPPIITSIAPETGTAVCIAENVVINGSFLTGTTHVTFEGGIEASGADVVVISDTEVHAKAPLNSLTGAIVVKKDAFGSNPIAEVKTDTLAIALKTVKLGPSTADLDFGSINNTTVCTSGTTTTSTIAIAITGGTGNFFFTYSAPNNLGVIGDINVSNYTTGNDETINPQYTNNNNLFTLKTVTDAEGCDVPLTQISGSYMVMENTRALVEAGGDALGELSYYLPDGLTFTLDNSPGGPLLNPPSFSGASGVNWTNPASSDGTFDNSATLKPDFTVGINDIFNNSVVLTLSTTGNPVACDAITDVLTINFVADATATPEIVGGGNIFCWDGSANPVIILAGTVGGDATGGLWERVADGLDPDDGTYKGFDAGASITSTNLAGSYQFTTFETTQGFANLTLIPTGGVGTPSAEPMTLSLSSKPTINYSNPATSVCEGETSIIYSVSDNVGSSYSWTVPTTDGTTFVGQGTSTILVDWGSGTTIIAGTQTINVVETNTEGCSGNADLIITVNELPPIVFNPSQTNFTTADTPLVLELEDNLTNILVEGVDGSITFSGQAVYKDSNNDWLFNPSLLVYDDVTPANNNYIISYSFTNNNNCTSSGTEVFTLFDANNLITGLARAYCTYDNQSITLDPFLQPNESDYAWRLQENGVLFSEVQSTTAGLIKLDPLLLEYVFRPDSAGKYLNTSEERELLVRYFTFNSSTGKSNSRGQLTTVFSRPTLDFSLTSNRECSTTPFIDLTPTNNISVETGTFFEFSSNRLEPNAITYDSDIANPTDKTKWKNFKLNINNLIVQDSINGDTVDIIYKYAEGNQFSIVCENTITKKMVIYAQPFKPKTTEPSDTYCVTDLNNIPAATVSNHITGNDSNGNPVEARVIWKDNLGTEISNDPFFKPNPNQIPLATNSFFVTQVLQNGCESEQTEVIFINFTGITYDLINNCYDGAGSLNIGFPEGNNAEISRLDWEIQDLAGNPVQTYPDVSPSQLIVLNVGNNFEPGGYILNLDLETTSGCIASFTKKIAVLESITVDDSNIYFENFENDNGGWVAQANNVGTSWEYGIPNGTVINTPITGQNVWMTGLNTGYNANSTTNLYSACYNITNLSRPMIKLNTMFNTSSDDGAVVQYTSDNQLGTATWNILGELETGVDWYNTQNITASPGDQATVDFGWSADTLINWQESKHVLDTDNVILRVQFKSGSTERDSHDGMAIDNVFIGNRTRTVLLENFTSTQQATSTLNQNDSIQTFQANIALSDPSAIAVIQYHPGIDGVDEVSSSPDSDARALYYGINATPRIAIDGKANNEQVFSVWGEKEYQTQALDNSPVEIVTSVVSSGSNIKIASTVTANEDIPANYIVHTVIVENVVLLADLNIPSVPSGETEFNYVVRKMLPNASGEKFTAPLAAKSTVTTETNSWSPTNVMSASEYTIIVFVQNEVTREIYQTQIITPTDDAVLGIEEDLEITGMAAYPNPANEFITLQLKRPVNKNTQVQVFNQLGQVVVSSYIEIGNDQLELKTQNLTPGIYYIQTELKGEPIRKRILVQHK